MKYSVIIPAYNCEDTLEQTISSIRKSGLEDYEVIIVDDGSSDKTPGICDELAEKHSNIIVIHQENAGVSAARNRGLKEAIGEYVLFFDADDTVDEGSLLRATEIVEREQPDMLMFGMSFDYYGKGKMYRRDEMKCDEEKCIDGKLSDEEFDGLYACNYLTPIWNKFYKNEIIRKNELSFDGTLFLMEDFLFSLDCLKKCESIYVLPDAIYRYKQADDEGNSFRRLKRIPSLSEYMVPFEERLSEYKNVLASMFFMLLRMKLRFADVDEIKLAAEDFAGSRYATEDSLLLCTAADRAFANELLNGDYQNIYLKNRKSILRHKIANKVKQSAIYGLLKN